MGIKPRPARGITDLIGRRFAGDGVQEAHIIGVRFYGSPLLAWLRPLLGVNEATNFAVLPESERGSAILGVAAHFGNQNSSFDRFFFENDDSSPKFLDTLKRRSELPDANPAALRADLLNFLDYVKVP